MVKWVIMSFFTIFLGAVVGFGFSTRKVVIIWYHIVGVTLLIFFVSFVSGYFGRLLGDYFSQRFLEIMVGLGFLAIGGFLMLSKPLYPGTKDILLFSTAIQLDVFLLSFDYARTHPSGFVLALTIALFSLGSIVVGIIYGSRRWSNWRVQTLLPHLSGLIIFLVGTYKLL
jgi:putative Ca2+/H+ antiporter (TMEM165/GDT1 family)